MYEELVKRLREATGWKNASEHYSLMKEAAYAIEEQSVEIKKLKKKVRSLQNEVDSLKSAASWDEDIRRGQVQGMW